MTYALSDAWWDCALAILEAGYCPFTGRRFDLAPMPDGSNNPNAPSVDRVDSTKDYTDDNCRIVVWAFNSARGVGSDDDLLALTDDFRRTRGETIRSATLDDYLASIRKPSPGCRPPLTEM